jgi:hypothetical protein
VRRIGYCLYVIALALLLTLPGPGWAQADQSQQLQLFNQMTPEQQQAFLQQLGGQGGSGQGGMGLGIGSSQGLGGLLGGGSLNGSQ